MNGHLLGCDQSMDHCSNPHRHHRIQNRHPDQRHKNIEYFNNSERRYQNMKNTIPGTGASRGASSAASPANSIRYK